MGNLINSFGTLDDLAAAAAADAGLGTGDGATVESAQLITQNRQIGWETARVQPPSDLYVTIDDVLRLTTWTWQGASEVDIAGRLLQPDGSIKYLFQQVTGIPQGVKTFDIHLAEGFLLDCVVTTPSANIQRGTTFVQISLVHGSSSAPQFSHVLIQDYVWSKSLAQWPGSPIRSATEGPGAVFSNSIAPAQGADWSIANGNITRVAIRFIYSSLSTSATVATRVPQLVIRNASSTIIWARDPGATQVASVNWAYNFAPGIDTKAPVFNQVSTALPNPCILEPSQTIGVSTIALNALDTWSQVFVTWEQWIEPT